MIKNKFKCCLPITISSLCICSGLYFSDAFASSASGVEARCERTLNNCLDRAEGTAGAAAACRNAYENCVTQGRSAGSAYEECKKSGKTAQECRDEYQSSKERENF